MKKILIALTLLAFTAVFAVGCAVDEDEGLLRDIVSVQLNIDVTPNDLSPYTQWYANPNTPARKFLEAGNLYSGTGGTACTDTSTAGKLTISCPGSTPVIKFELVAPSYDPSSFFKMGYYALFGRLVRDQFVDWQNVGNPVQDVTGSSYNNQTVYP